VLCGELRLMVNFKDLAIARLYTFLIHFLTGYRQVHAMIQYLFIYSRLMTNFSYVILWRRKRWAMCILAFCAQPTILSQGL
jgi:hypothetical protein